MGEELNILLSSSPLLLLMTPSLVTGLLLIVCAYRLIGTLGKRFLDTQDRQAAAFEKIADGVEKMKNDIEANSRLNDDIRITLAAMAMKIDHIYEITKRGGQ